MHPSNHRGVNLKRKARILIVDDNEDFLNTTSKILKEEGYDTGIAKTGAEALKRCRGEFYPLSMIDVKLPDMDGIRLVKQMQTFDPDMRNIIITGQPSIESAQEALNMGAHAYLVKPLEVETMLKTIEQQIEKFYGELKKRYLSLKKDET
jgi:DNA-binding NtrC family response regulator